VRALPLTRVCGQWDKGKIVGLGWTDAEQLVVVLDDGNVRLYTLQGEMRSFSLGKEAKEQGVLDCRIWGTGLVALTGRFRLVSVAGFDEPFPRLLADMSSCCAVLALFVGCGAADLSVRTSDAPGLNEPPHSWVVIEPLYTNSHNVEVLVATRETVLVVDGDSVQDQVPPPFLPTEAVRGR
jgi:vacuolar protein sorting-associated protein 16